MIVKTLPILFRIIYEGRKRSTKICETPYADSERISLLVEMGADGESIGVRLSICWTFLFRYAVITGTVIGGMRMETIPGTGLMTTSELVDFKKGASVEGLFHLKSGKGWIRIR